MAEKITFELVSPEKKVMETEAVMVVVPGEDGDFGVLAEHSPLVSTIRPGVINVYRDDMTTISDQVFLDAGFADVTAERCTVLAEKAISLSQIDRAAVEAEISQLESDIPTAETDFDKQKLARQLDVATAKLSALQNAA